MAANDIPHQLSTTVNPDGTVDFMANKTKGHYLNLRGNNTNDTIDFVHKFMCDHGIWNIGDSVVKTKKHINFTPCRLKYNDVSFVLTFYNYFLLAKRREMTRNINVENNRKVLEKKIRATEPRKQNIPGTPNSPTCAPKHQNRYDCVQIVPEKKKNITGTNIPSGLIPTSLIIDEKISTEDKLSTKYNSDAIDESDIVSANSDDSSVYSGHSRNIPLKMGNNSEPVSISIDDSDISDEINNLSISDNESSCDDVSDDGPLCISESSCVTGDNAVYDEIILQSDNDNNIPSDTIDSDVPDGSDESDESDESGESDESSSSEIPPPPKKSAKVSKKKTPVKKPATVKKPAAKKPAVKKPAVKKPAAKKPAAKKPAAKKTVTKRPATKKTTVAKKPTKK